MNDDRTPDLPEQIRNLPCKPYDGTDAYTHYCHGHRDARHAAAELVASASDPVGELPSDILDYLKGIYAFLQSAAPDGFADEAFRLPPSPSRNLRSLQDAIEGDASGELPTPARQDSGAAGAGRRAIDASPLPQEPQEGKALTDAKIEQAWWSLGTEPDGSNLAGGTTLDGWKRAVRWAERELRGAQEGKAWEDWQDIPDDLIAGILRFAWKREPTLREITSAAKAARPSVLTTTLSASSKGEQR